MKTTFEIKMTELVAYAYEVATDFICRFDAMIEQGQLGTPYKGLYGKIKVSYGFAKEESYKSTNSFALGTYSYLSNEISIRTDVIAYTGYVHGWPKEKVGGELLSTIAHELGHALHAKLDNADYIKYRFERLYLTNDADYSDKNAERYVKAVQHMEDKANHYAISHIIPLIKGLEIPCYEEFLHQLWDCIMENGTAKSASRQHRPMAS